MKDTNIEMEIIGDHVPPVPKGYFPTGLLGDIARFYYSSAVKPIPEVALTAALTTMAGVCGRQYNVKDFGLGIYMLLLAKSGVGKEGASNGIDALFNACKPYVSDIDKFQGPANFGSAEGSARLLMDKPCFVTVQGEFGDTLAKLCHPRANQNEINKKQFFLNIYTKNGKSKSLKETVYSDTKKNISSVNAPSVTILGESVPHKVYGVIDSSQIEDGFLPRFIVVEYLGDRPTTNPYLGHAPNEQLLNRFISLVQTVDQCSQQEHFVDIPLNEEAVVIAQGFDNYCTNEVNHSEEEVARQLWSRTFVNALKIAGLYAVGEHHHNPLITANHMNWAITFVCKCLRHLHKQFTSGVAGTIESRQLFELKRIMKKFLNFDKETKRKNQCSVGALNYNVVPGCFISKHLSRLACFSKDPRGRKKAIDVTIDFAIDCGEIEQIPYDQVAKDMNARGKFYALNQ